MEETSPKNESDRPKLYLLLSVAVIVGIVVGSVFTQVATRSKYARQQDQYVQSADVLLKDLTEMKQQTDESPTVVQHIPQIFVTVNQAGTKKVFVDRENNLTFEYPLNWKEEIKARDRTDDKGVFNVNVYLYPPQATGDKRGKGSISVTTSESTLGFGLHSFSVIEDKTQTYNNIEWGVSYIEDTGYPEPLPEYEPSGTSGIIARANPAPTPPPYGTLGIDTFYDTENDLFYRTAVEDILNSFSHLPDDVEL